MDDRPQLPHRDPGSRALVSCFLVLLAAGPLLGQDAREPARDRPARPAFDADRAWGHLAHQVGIGPRPSGSAANRRTREYLASELTRYGLEPVVEE